MEATTVLGEAGSPVGGSGRTEGVSGVLAGPAPTLVMRRCEGQSRLFWIVATSARRPG
jgi:hypothetical protein